MLPPPPTTPSWTGESDRGTTGPPSFSLLTSDLSFALTPCPMWWCECVKTSPRSPWVLIGFLSACKHKRFKNLKKIKIRKWREKNWRKKTEKEKIKPCNDDVDVFFSLSFAWKNQDGKRVDCSCYKNYNFPFKVEPLSSSLPPPSLSPYHFNNRYVGC